jgi:hypothetical protein
MVRRILTLAILPLALNLAFADQDHSHHHRGGETVISGELTFPTSCGASVQKPFESAVAALHSFEYEVAEQQFHTIAQKNPDCGIAYWGEAMSIWHQLWSRPTDKELARGKELLAKGSKAKHLDTRERQYVTALTKFYEKPKEDYEARTVAYSKAMESVFNGNPQDTEAAVFYALSLLASAPDEDPQLKNQRQAVEILNKVYAANPRHPGIAHYIIHSTDNPELAPLGLEAARHYASLAPESPHAVHMPSHIFARLGLWRDDIKSNAAAVEVANKLNHLHMEHHKTHSMDFMHYAYLQIGDDRNAQRISEEIARIDRNTWPEEFKDFRDMRVAALAARYALERRRWKEAAELKADASMPPIAQSITYLANAVGAGHLRDKEAAARASKQYDEMVEATKKSPKAYYVKAMEYGQKEAAAWAKFAAGDVDGATAMLGEVADTQDKIGKAETDAPAREMLADMLLEAKRPADALREYEISLKTDPNRFNGLYGAAQAAEQAGKSERSKSYYAQLLKNCEGVDSDRAELLKARTLVAAR